jgi:hypothetical protein
MIDGNLADVAAAREPADQDGLAQLRLRHETDLDGHETALQCRASLANS